MLKLKNLVWWAFSIGIHDGLAEEKKLALRISLMDAYWSLVAMSFYTVYSFQNNLFPAAYIHLCCFALTILGTVFLGLRKYDVGRILIHQVGLAEVFITADAVGAKSGYEFYYFITIAMPFITFTFEEQWKATMLTTIACCTLVFQQFAGTGLIMDHMIVPSEDRLIAVLFVMFYVLVVFSIGRIQLKRAQKKLHERSDELLKASNLIALGEMSAGIAHEINNPLQSLSLNLMVMKDKFPHEDLKAHYAINESLIQKMGKMVQGLKDLSKSDQIPDTEVFVFSKVMEDVLIITSGRIKKNNIQVFVHDEDLLKTRASKVQITQVLINLFNNSIDAIKHQDVKWIKVEVESWDQFLQISISDSGNGIASNVADNMMQPFFTTKDRNHGTGLGLSISKSIMEKNNGSLFYDSSSENTKFVMLLPKEGP